MKFVALTLLFISTVAHAADVSFMTGLDLAMKESEAVKEQLAQNNISEWQKSAAIYNILPKVTANAGNTQTQGPTNIPGAPVYANALQDSVSATLNVYHGGADYHGIKSAQAQVHATMANTENTILQTEESAATDLLNTVYQRQYLEILQASLQYDNLYESIADKKYRNGAEALEQLDKIRIDRSNTEAEVRDAEVALSTALAKQQVWIENNQIVNEWPWLVRLRSEKISGVLRKHLTAGGDLERKLQNRPDVRASLFGVETQSESLAAAKGALLPSIDLAYSYGKENLGPGWEDNWTSSITLTWTIFNGLKDYTSYRVANENRTIAEYSYELLRRQAQADLELSETNFATSVQTAVERENVLDSSLRLLKTTEKRFQTGHATPDELSLDQHRVIQARVLVAKGWLEAHLALIHFIHSRGLRVKEL